MKQKLKYDFSLGNVVITCVFFLLCIFIVYPIISIVSVSFTGKEEILESGFKLIPEKIDLTAYKYILQEGKALLKAYGTTILVSVSGTAIGVAVTSLYAYAVSRPDFKFKKFFTFLVMFTMFFSGGMSASYITVVNVLKLKNSIWVLILPGTFSAMGMIIMRSYFQNLPHSMVESAMLDGANEYTIFFRIMLPLAKPAVATLALTIFIAKWNSYYESMMYMDTGNWVTIQLLLQRMLNQAEFLKNNSHVLNLPGVNVKDIANDSMNMAMCVLTVVPMLLVFPRFQKYFVKGMAIGSVKG